MAIASLSGYTGVLPRHETNDCTDGVASDVARGAEPVLRVLLPVLLYVLALRAICRRRHARVAAHVPPHTLAGPAPVTPDLVRPVPRYLYRYNPALTPDGNALLRRLRSHHLPAIVARSGLRSHTGIGPGSSHSRAQKRKWTKTRPKLLLSFSTRW